MGAKNTHGHTTRLKHCGPAANRGARWSPMGLAQHQLVNVIPHAYAQKEHYDQRRLVCVDCGNVPKKVSALLDVERGYICKATGACAKRARES